MTRLLTFALVLSAALMVGGCSTVRVCDEDGHKMVCIENSGWKILNFIPLASGDPEYPNENTCLWFTDSVTLSSNIDLLNREVVRQKARYPMDVNSYKTEEHVFVFLLKRSMYHTSAELIP